MAQIQIQLPDDLYQETKGLCEEHKMSLDELARRGIEHMITVLNREKEDGSWLPPTAQSLGWSDLTDEELKRHAQEGQTDESGAGGGKISPTAGTKGQDDHRELDGHNPRGLDHGTS